MKRRGPQRGGVLPALAACLAVGIMIGWWLRSGAPLPAVVPASPLIAGPKGAALAGEVAATTGEPLVGTAEASPERVMSELRGRALRLPIDGAEVDEMEGDFAERRNGDRRRHEAVDILAPRHTPVHAVDDGTIAKLFFSKGGGGITIYQFDPTGRFAYYYAHLERYTYDLREGRRVIRGEVMGYVGTTGNAPKNTPHLHFAVFELDADRHWWKGRAIDPYLIFRS